MKVGVFALQGAFLEHEHALERLGVEWREIRRAPDFRDDLDGIILPGGESTTQGLLLREEGLMDPVKEAIKGGLPVFGTCAGMILLAKKLSNDENVYFDAMDITVRRNAYGRQLDSFRTELDFKGLGRVSAVFIRGPIVDSCGKDVEILAKADDKIVAVRQKHMLATAFHPELTDELGIHTYFLELIRGKH